MEILTVALALLSISFAIAYVSAVYRIKKITNAVKELLSAKIELDAAYRNFASIKKATTETDIHTKNFIKFLSESRDWAYEYIEGVQEGIKKFIIEVNPQIEYFSKQNNVTNNDAQVSEFTIKKISKEIEELKKFLPEENNDRR